MAESLALEYHDLMRALTPVCDRESETTYVPIPAGSSQYSVS